MLEETYKSFLNLAEKVNWKSYNCNDLFREYIVHENDELRDNFYSAIVCRYWGQAGKVYTKFGGHIPFDQCYDVLIDAINYTLEKRVWENELSSIYQDQRGPDKALHISLKRMFSLSICKSTTQKRKANFNTLSLDALHESYSDAAEGIFLSKETSSGSKLVDNIINNYIDKKRFIDALFIDMICLQDTKVDKVVPAIFKLNIDNYEYFKDVYNMNLDEFKKMLITIHKTGRNSMKIRFKSVLLELRKEMEVNGKVN